MQAAICDKRDVFFLEGSPRQARWRSPGNGVKSLRRPWGLADLEMPTPMIYSRQSKAARSQKCAPGHILLISA